MEIPGTERTKIKEINTAAEKYIGLRDARMAMLRKEVEAKAALIDVMERNVERLSRDGNDNLIYRYDDRIVVVADKLQVKIRSAEDEEGGSEDGDE